MRRLILGAVLMLVMVAVAVGSALAEEFQQESLQRTLPVEVCNNATTGRSPAVALKEETLPSGEVCFFSVRPPEP
jgi:hypothetical protein